MADDDSKPIHAPKPKPGLPVIRRMPEGGLPLLFADQMMIRTREDGLFILYFLQTQPPLAVTQEEVDAIDHVDAVCVAQVLVTAPQMQKNLDALNDNFQQFVEKMNAAVVMAKAEEGTKEPSKTK